MHITIICTFRSKIAYKDKNLAIYAALLSQTLAARTNFESSKFKYHGNGSYSNKVMTIKQN